VITEERLRELEEIATCGDLSTDEQLELITEVCLLRFAIKHLFSEYLSIDCMCDHFIDQVGDENYCADHCGKGELECIRHHCGIIQRKEQEAGR
jgi:hypothetical protein